MKEKADKSHNEKQGKTAKAAALQKRADTNGLQVTDNREVSASQTGLQTIIDHSPRMTVQRRRIERSFDTPVQRQGPEEDEELMQGKFTFQRAELEDEELMQGKFAARRTENKTGLPDELKTGIENLSGLSLDNVRVHSNSSKPATVGAHAYTQGTDIHVAPGQMKHLPHEAWHVVQQMQGRVMPTMQMQDGVPVNDDKGLERGADEMGALAAQGGHGLSASAVLRPPDGGQRESVAQPRGGRPPDPFSADVIQRTVTSSAMTRRNNRRGKWRLQWDAEETGSVTVRFEYIPRLGANQIDYTNDVDLPDYASIARLDGVEWQGKEVKVYATEQHTDRLRRYSIEVQNDGTVQVRRELTIGADTPQNIRDQSERTQRIFGSTGDGGGSAVYRALATAFDRGRQALGLAVAATNRTNIPRRGLLRRVMTTHFRGAGADQLAHIRGIFSSIKTGLEENEENINDYYQGIRAGGAEGEAYLTQQQRDQWTETHAQGEDETLQAYQMRMLADIGSQSTIRLDYVQILSRQKDYVVRALVHEMAHKHGHVADYAYAHNTDAYEGMPATQAINNADSYAFAAVSFLQGSLVGHTELNAAGHFVTEELGALILGSG